MNSPRSEFDKASLISARSGGAHTLRCLSWRRGRRCGRWGRAAGVAVKATSNLPAPNSHNGLDNGAPRAGLRPARERRCPQRPRLFTLDREGSKGLSVDMGEFFVGETPWCRSPRACVVRSPELEVDELPPEHPQLRVVPSHDDLQRLQGAIAHLKSMESPSLSMAVL